MNITRTPGLVASLLLATSLAGCASAPAVVRSGDRADISFTCRLPDGRVAATTRPDSSFVSDEKSAYYLPRSGPETVTLVAGPPKADPKEDRVSFEDEIMKRLAAGLEGSVTGERYERRLQADRYPSTTPRERFVKIATVRKRQKEMRISLEEYRNKKGGEPRVGQRFVIDPLVPGTVAEVNDKEVLLRFAPEEGKPLVSPFGPMTLRDAGERYELEIQAQVGTLVRTGGMVGRISAVDKDSIEIDYGHPFGGENLSCTVDVVSVQAAAAPQGSESAAVAAPSTTLDPVAEQILNKGLATMLAQSGQDTGAGAIVRPGDLVTVQYTVNLEDGSLVATTRPEVARDPAHRKVSWYRDPLAFEPVELVAGKSEVMPGLAEAMVGMKPGSRQTMTLPPDKAFGPVDPAKLNKLPFSQTFPTTIRMPADEYVKRFSAFPILGKEVALMPYFPSKVVEVTEKDVALMFQVRDGATYNDTFGTLTVTVSGDNITTTLKPVIGAPFPLGEGFAVVIAADGQTFTVDLNHPLAGKTLLLEVEVAGVVPTPAGAADIPWNDDHDAGLARARQEGKPAFLILHADWCSWCKKTFSDTLPDPRIAGLRDRFVWVRVNSDKEQKYKQLYKQEGFPMMVLFKPDGTVLTKIDGYRDARALRDELKAVLH